MWLAKKEYLSDPSWNKRCRHWFSVKVLFQEACKGCVEPQVHFCQKRILCLAYLMTLGERVSNTRSANLLQWGHVNKCSFITTVLLHCDPEACSLKQDVMLPHLSWSSRGNTHNNIFRKFAMCIATFKKSILNGWTPSTPYAYILFLAGSSFLCLPSD